MQDYHTICVLKWTGRIMRDIFDGGLEPPTDGGERYRRRLGLLLVYLISGILIIINAVSPVASHVMDKYGEYDPEVPYKVGGLSSLMGAGLFSVLTVASATWLPAVAIYTVTKTYGFLTTRSLLDILNVAGRISFASLTFGWWVFITRVLTGLSTFNRPVPWGTPIALFLTVLCAIPNYIIPVVLSYIASDGFLMFLEEWLQ